MNSPLRLVIGHHGHIPYETRDDEFEYMYREELKPFLVALNNYPKISAVLHYSGVLLHRIEKAHPEFFMLISDLIARKQVELLGGGFYEPMLPLLPLSDKIGQIEMLTTYLRTQFGKKPQGCWLPAFAWEQNIPGTLNSCGINFTFLADTQFIQAGIAENALFAPCITEDQGKMVTVFPISTRLNQEFQRNSVHEVIAALMDAPLESNGERIITLFPQFFLYASDGSPRGDLDKTERINRFFEDLSSAEGLVDFTLPSKWHQAYRPINRCYFPNSAQRFCAPSPGSSDESAWVQPHQFLATHSEANGIYAKMMFTHVLINQLRGDKSRKRTAKEELWRAQGLDAFCPTESGGIARNSIRNTVYSSLLGAEKITREKGVFIPSILAIDFNLDGSDEYLLLEEYINCYIERRGAGVFEFDLLPKAWNYLDTYSPDRTQSKNRRTSFIEFIAPIDFSLDFSFEQEAGAVIWQFPQAGWEQSSSALGIRCCGAEDYTLQALDKAHVRATFTLPAASTSPFSPVEIEKTFRLRKDALELHYKLSNASDEPLDFAFIPRLDLSFSGEGEFFQRIYAQRMDNQKSYYGWESPLIGVRGIEIQDLKNEAILNFSVSNPFDACIMPVKTPCWIYGQEVEQYQSTCIMALNRLHLEARGFCELSVKLQISY